MTLHPLYSVVSIVRSCMLTCPQSRSHLPGSRHDMCRCEGRDRAPDGGHAAVPLPGGPAPQQGVGGQGATLHCFFAALTEARSVRARRARWNAVQKAKRRGLSIRGVATAKKYMEAVSPPMKRDRVG